MGLWGLPPLGDWVCGTPLQSCGHTWFCLPVSPASKGGWGPGPVGGNSCGILGAEPEGVKWGSPVRDMQKELAGDLDAKIWAVNAHVPSVGRGVNGAQS